LTGLPLAFSIVAGADLVEAVLTKAALVDSFFGFVVLLIITTPIKNKLHACFVQISFDDHAASNGRTVSDCARVLEKTPANAHRVTCLAHPNNVFFFSEWQKKSDLIYRGLRTKPRPEIQGDENFMFI
jgi:hypothetical protein